MKLFHARHPFLDEVAEEVANTGINVEEIVSEQNHPAKERAIHRIKTAIQSGRVKTMNESRREVGSMTPRNEIFSYAIARIIVSIVNDPKLIERYANAEAELTVYLVRHGEIRRGEKASLNELFEEYDFDSPTDSDIIKNGYAVTVSDYLTHADTDSRRWSLRGRILDDGRVHLSRDQTYGLIERAITDDIQSDLPLDVPTPVADALEKDVQEIRNLIKETSIPGTIPRGDVEFDAFPVPFGEMYERAREDELLSPLENFVFISFLDHVGLEEQKIRKLVNKKSGHTPTENQIDNIVGNDLPPPGYEALVRLGLCDEEMKDEPHPLTKYRNSR